MISVLVKISTLTDDVSGVTPKVTNVESKIDRMTAMLSRVLGGVPFGST